MKIERKWEEYHNKYITKDRYYPKFEISTSISNKKPIWFVEIQTLDNIIELDNSILENKNINEIISYLEETYPIDIESIDYLIDDMKKLINDNLRMIKSIQESINSNLAYIKSYENYIKSFEKELEGLLELRKSFED